MTDGAGRVRVSVVGASGYTGGELLRLLIDHPGVDVAQATSRRMAGNFVHQAHPNLRGRTSLSFAPPDDLRPCDLLFLCLPHTESARAIDRYSAVAPRIVDLSADFRLRSADEYSRWYGTPHPAPAWLDRFVYGLPELRREELRRATHASGVGCNATAVNLALMPLARRGLIRSVVADLKVGSSEGGAEPTGASHHPERRGVVRPFALAGHRHVAEVRQELMGTRPFDLHMTVTSVELVRGVQCTAHVFLTEPVDEKRAWRIFRESYADEPFVRIVRDRSGIHRYPEPSILAGSNWADVGFEPEAGTDRLVVVSAIDNLMKGAAGSGVQCMNLMCGFDERAGLTFPGLHPA